MRKRLLGKMPMEDLRKGSRNIRRELSNSEAGQTPVKGKRGKEKQLEKIDKLRFIKLRTPIH